jgi:hypothetical protein
LQLCSIRVHHRAHLSKPSTFFTASMTVASRCS